MLLLQYAKRMLQRYFVTSMPDQHHQEVDIFVSFRGVVAFANLDTRDLRAKGDLVYRPRLFFVKRGVWFLTRNNHRLLSLLRKSRIWLTDMRINQKNCTAVLWLVVGNNLQSKDLADNFRFLKYVQADLLKS